MSGQQIHRVSGHVMVGLSLVALLTVLSALRASFRPFSIHPQPPLTDEGTQAHLFQLSVVALAPAILFFLATADWKRSTQVARPLAVSAVLTALAFVLLYYLEHHQ